MKIAENKFVALTYDLSTVNGEKKELVEQITSEHPLEFIAGLQMMSEPVEAKLMGLKEGDDFEFTLQPEDIFGEYDENKIMDLPMEIFEQDGKIDETMLVIGNKIPMMDNQGKHLFGIVKSIAEDTVKMDFNHPMAGQVMHFKGKVHVVREATQEDIDKFFSNSCGCGSCDGSDCGSGGCCGDEGGGCCGDEGGKGDCCC